MNIDLQLILVRLAREFTKGVTRLGSLCSVALVRLAREFTKRVARLGSWCLGCAQGDLAAVRIFFVPALRGALPDLRSPVVRLAREFGYCDSSGELVPG